MNIEEAREVLIAHSKSKQNGIFDAEAVRSAKMLNPICGDHVEMRAMVRQNTLSKIGFAAKACAICTASSSLLSQAANGWTAEEVRIRRESFEKAVTGSTDDEWPNDLQEFRSLEHLRVNARRRACAILPWLALEKLASNEDKLKKP